jgi:hypothetical protein
MRNSMEGMMKKTLLGMLALSVLAFAGTNVFAAAAAGQSRPGTLMIAAGDGEDFVLTHPAHDEHNRDREMLGAVVSINKDKREVVIKDDSSHLDEPVILEKDDLPKVKVGDEIKVRLWRNTNVARVVIVVEEKKPGPEN